MVAAGWWVAIVELVPASMRPYIGGSQHNSELELIFGYNGFGRHHRRRDRIGDGRRRGRSAALLAAVPSAARQCLG